MTGAVPLKEADHGGRVRTEVSEINSLTTLAKKQKPVERLEKLTGRLVDTIEVVSG